MKTLKRVGCLSMVTGMLILTAGCGEKDHKDIEWVMPSTTAQENTADEQGDKELTVEGAKALMESEFAGSTAEFVEEVTVEDEKAYRFIVSTDKTEYVSSVEWINDYMTVSANGGKILQRMITDEKAEAILTDAFEGAYTSFTKTGNNVEIDGFQHTEYTAVGMTEKIYINATTGAQVLKGNYDASAPNGNLEYVVEEKHNH
ncbi:MAG: hypothetical protein E7269_06670 [Lachnospiraceae bacterium]|nr:hypothetical protein [Lachnospiraceae bacterium]